MFLYITFIISICQYTHYIVIDNTGIIADEYSIEVSDGNIYVKSSYNTIDEAIAYLTGDFLGDEKIIELKNGDKITVMSIGKKDMYTKEQLMQVLTDVYNDDNACIIGQQCNHGREDIICKELNRLFTFSCFYGIIKLIDKLEFDEVVN